MRRLLVAVLSLLGVASSNLPGQTKTDSSTAPAPLPTNERRLKIEKNKQEQQAAAAARMNKASKAGAKVNGDGQPAGLAIGKKAKNTAEKQALKTSVQQKADKNARERNTSSPR